MKLRTGRQDRFCNERLLKDHDVQLLSVSFGFRLNLPFVTISLGFVSSTMIVWEPNAYF